MNKKIPANIKARRAIRHFAFKRNSNQTTVTITIKKEIEPNRILEIRYIPDRFIFDKSALDDWLGCYNFHEFTIEKLAQCLMADFSNEIIPAWAVMEIKIGPDFTVAVEDKQPTHASLKRISF